MNNTSFVNNESFDIFKKPEEQSDVFAAFEVERRNVTDMRRISNKPKKDRSKVKAARKQRCKNK